MAPPTNTEENTMPEAPEVRWMCKNLQFIVGARINDFTVYRGEVVSFGDTQFTKREDEATLFLQETLNEASILSIENRGKFTIIETNKATILTHLGFTGWWIPQNAPEHRPRKFIHTLKEENIRLVIHTDRGPLKYLDPRLFGRNRIYPTKQQAIESRHLNRMGPDADTELGINVLLKAIPKSGRRIKDLIMDQQLVSGVGNYLACEILFDARIHGGRPAKSLTKQERNNLSISILKNFRLATVAEDRNWWNVFQKVGEPCFHCGHLIIREVWGNRGNYTCLKCQNPPLNWEQPGK